MKKLLSILLAAVLLGSAFSCSNGAGKAEARGAAPAVDYGSNREAGRYVKVNDIKLYCEVYGEGEPLLLLHGNKGSIGNFVHQIPELSRHFKVIAVDSRGQGRSSDSDKEITYALMASDVSGLMDELGLTSAHVVGWSDGGNVGLELAFAQSDRVRKLVTFGANYTHENWMAPPDDAVMEGDDPLIMSSSPMLKGYREGLGRLSPDVKKKLDGLMERYPNVTPDQLKAIRVPVLIVVGDHDAISLDQTITLFGCLPHAELFIVPEATHFVPVERPDVINREVIRFLSAPYRDIDRYYWAKLIE